MVTALLRLCPCQGTRWNRNGKERPESRPRLWSTLRSKEAEFFHQPADLRFLAL